ncbi:MAG: imidazolonepropionase [Deltaproteobacteria bacterium]|nr:MAG: imidazolonepropionase [Deltaproteobacteria bacterium]
MSEQLYINANIYSPKDSGSPSSGPDQGSLVTYRKGALLVKDGLIEKIGQEKDVTGSLSQDLLTNAVDCQGRALIPGFVDPHTHCCFAALREEEFQMRAAGTPYLEILKQGGGILSSVKAVEDANVDLLYQNTLSHIDRAMSLGTTSIEVKSGYGLRTESELKMLEAIDRASAHTPLDVVATYLGAHAVPPAYKKNSDAFITYLIEESLPAVKKQNIAEFCDVFCEEGVFSIRQGRRLLSAAQDLGMRVKIHADEVHDLGGAGLAAELGAISADHLLAASDENLQAMVEKGVIANLLPGTAFSLRKSYARARDMIEMGLPVALATDCNPGSCYTESMQFIFALAVLNMRMTPEEALTGVTLNPAYSLGLADKTGSLDVGKQADFLLLNGTTPSILAYHAGVSSVDSVYKKGVKVAG